LTQKKSQSNLNPSEFWQVPSPCNEQSAAWQCFVVQISSHSSKVLLESSEDNLPQDQCDEIEVNNIIQKIQRLKNNAQKFKNDLGAKIMS